jgi:transketolase
MTEQLAERPIDRRTLANAIRALAMDAVEAAKSGHPGMPMGMADIAEVLWNDFLRFDPAAPQWPNRDRFVLSNGHGSMLQYALLHLSGYDLPIEELKRFRQWHSKTPGHPEVHETPGVETTTGPLGQGIANAVGMALAEKVLAARFNRDGHTIVDHMTYCFIGDGCLMEGISHEVASLAGTLKLGKLVVVWDDNGISIDGKVGGWFTDDTPKRFEAYGWEVLPEIDGHNPEAIKAALVSAALDPERPTLICCRTTIGYGAPTKAGSESSHGAPLGAAEIAGARAALGWTHGPFEIPAEVYAAWDARPRGARWHAEWKAAFARYAAVYPELAAEFERVMAGQLPADYAALADSLIQQFATDTTAWATRKASQLCLERLVPAIPELCGGSADLAHSNYSIVKASRDVRSAADGGNYVYFGVREFGMTAIANGMALHGGLIPYTATFLVFSDYARNAIRLSALMGVRQIYVYTHDSIGLGEDGPTHQPVEHLASLRLIPNLDVWRPADGVETAVAWTEALASARRPSLLALSRQNLPALSRDAAQIAAIRQGGYVLKDCAGTPQLILIGTGSEVQLALAAATQLAAEGVAVRVVSMPSTTRFDAQPAAYRESVLPKAVRARVAVEAAHVDGWHRYVGLDGEIIGMTRFGASAPEKVCYQQFGITVEAVVAAARRVLAG